MAKKTSDIYNLLLTDFFKKNNSPKTIIIELYRTFDEDDFDEADFEHQLLANAEIGQSLRFKIDQKEHFIYVLDETIENELKKAGKQPLNLTNANNLRQFHSLLNPGDSLTVVAQGSPVEEQMAGLDAEAFIELINEDLELEDRGLINLELYCCNMGDAQAFRDTIRTGLASSCETVISYTAVLAANSSGKIFIKYCNKHDEDSRDDFYGEEASKLFTVTDTTQSSTTSEYDLYGS